MKKIPMVRCLVTSPNRQRGNPENDERTVRYVPLDIFRLWRYLMEDVKGFGIHETQTSVWMDQEAYSKEKPGIGEHMTESVVEISFVYALDHQVGRPVVRYFPEAYVDEILGFFLRNFSEEYIQGGTQRTMGVFVRKPA